MGRALTREGSREEGNIHSLFGCRDNHGSCTAIQRDAAETNKRFLEVNST